MGALRRRRSMPDIVGYGALPGPGRGLCFQGGAGPVFRSVPARSAGRSAGALTVARQLDANVEFVMPKAKIHSGAAKRFKKTGAGAYKRKSANRSHILTKMTTKRKRQLRRTSRVHANDRALVERMLRAR